MTMRTRFAVVCECGHEGNILLTENDQPYSKIYEHYSLENLKGTSYNASSAGWEEFFEKSGIACPKCNKKLTPHNMKK